MKRLDLFDFFANDLSFTWKHNLIQGILFIGFGIIILFFPQLLLAMIASFFVLLGIIFVAAAWFMRQFRRKYDGFREELFELF